MKWAMDMIQPGEIFLTDSGYVRDSARSTDLCKVLKYNLDYSGKIDY